jgi:hypothetical protein
MIIIILLLNECENEVRKVEAGKGWEGCANGISIMKSMFR